MQHFKTGKEIGDDIKFYLRILMMELKDVNWVKLFSSRSQGEASVVTVFSLWTP